VLGGSHFCANRPVPVLTLCYENLIAFRIYIYVRVFGLVRTEQVLKNFIFSKLNNFSNIVILAYIIITIDFPIWFSQPSFHYFWKLIFNLKYIFYII
jgi:hypothetical protein